MKPSLLASSVRGLAAALASLLGVAAFAAPAHVLIRVPVGAAVPAELPPLLAHWRQSGQVADVLLLTQGRAEKPGEKPGFAALAVLAFPSEGACAAWERAAAPALPAGLMVRRADALTHGEVTPRDSTRAVFVVNAYTPKVPRERYDEFAQGYLRPLYEAQRQTGTLVRYTMYLEHGAVGSAEALAVLEYRDPDAFARAGELKTGIRERLTATVPSYAAFHPIKDTLRVDGGGTFATYTALPTPGVGARSAAGPDRGERTIIARAGFDHLPTPEPRPARSQGSE